MIIEGKHAEVGRGIFISDIQAESVAEQVRWCFIYYLLQFRRYYSCYIINIVAGRFDCRRHDSLREQR